MLTSNNSGDETAATQLRVTQSAAAKIYELKEDEQDLDLKLRIFVTGGGCSGFQYGFSFEKESNPDDFIIVKKVAEETKDPANEADVKILVDAMSMGYLKGAEIDYRKDLSGEQFIIRNNPNAKTTCGCGSSFSASEEDTKS